MSVTAAIDTNDAIVTEQVGVGEQDDTAGAGLGGDDQGRRGSGGGGVGASQDGGTVAGADRGGAV